MTHSAQDLFFDIKRRFGLLFVELRTRDTGRLLTPGEALKVADLPEGFTLEPNPETSGAAAFISRTHKGPMMTKVMQDAGFRYDAEDAVKFDARVLEHAKLAEEKEAEMALNKLVKAVQEGQDGAIEALRAHIETTEPGHTVASIDQGKDGQVIVDIHENKAGATAGK